MTKQTGFTVDDLDTEESYGFYDTLSEARNCVRRKKIRAYWITAPDGWTVVERCEPYDGDDSRAAQGLGQ